jgi:preprotein translocase subunit SecE
MGRLLKPKTDNQKIKLKNKQAQAELNSPADGISESADTPKKDVPKRPQVAKKNTPSADKEPNLIDKSRVFLDEVNAERKKVVWPAKNQVIGSTAVVIVLVIIVSSFLGLFDLVLKSLVQLAMTR